MGRDHEERRQALEHVGWGEGRKGGAAGELRFLFIKIIIITCIFIALNTRFLSAEQEVYDNKQITIKSGIKQQKLNS